MIIVSTLDNTHAITFKNKPGSIYVTKGENKITDEQFENIKDDKWFNKLLNRGDFSIKEDTVAKTSKTTTTTRKSRKTTVKPPTTEIKKDTGSK